MQWIQALGWGRTVNPFYDYMSIHKINKIGFRPNKVTISEKEIGLFTGEIKFIEYLGSEQFIYVDCGINEKLVVVKTNPDYKIPLKKIVGLNILSKDLYFFLKNGEVLI